MERDLAVTAVCIALLGGLIIGFLLGFLLAADMSRR